jgi:tetratricopeptide (TPR) repeat protein
MRRKESRTRQPAELSANVAGSGASGMDDVTETAEEPDERDPGAEARDPSAVAHWRDIVMSDPGNVNARRRLARIHELRGEMTMAIEHLEAARTAQPDDVDLVVDLAHALISIKRLDPAERELRRALKAHPDNAAVHLALGIISFRRGLYAQADAELKRTLELDPSSGTAYFYRGEALNQLSRLDEALEMLQRATQLQPNNGRAFYVMGILYDRKRRPDEAAAMYRKAREVGTT